MKIFQSSSQDSEDFEPSNRSQDSQKPTFEVEEGTHLGSNGTAVRPSFENENQGGSSTGTFEDETAPRASGESDEIAPRASATVRRRRREEKRARAKAKQAEKQARSKASAASTDFKPSDGSQDSQNPTSEQEVVGKVSNPTFEQEVAVSSPI